MDELFGNPPRDESSSRVKTRKPWRYMGALGLILLGCGFGIVWPAVARIPQVYQHFGGWVWVLPLLSPLLVYLGFRLIPMVFGRPAWRRWGPVAWSGILAATCLLFGSLVAWLFRVMTGL